MARELPTISSSAQAHSTYSVGNVGQLLVGAGGGGGGAGFLGGAGGIFDQQQFTVWPGLADYKRDIERAARINQAIENKEPPMAEKVAGRRVVQVYIADPDENVPLDQALLYTGPSKLTDLTDQELFFELDIKQMLDAHNAKRTTLVNKKVKERTEYLEPARVRDLKMVVVNVATF